MDIPRLRSSQPGRERPRFAQPGYFKASPKVKGNILETSRLSYFCLQPVPRVSVNGRYMTMTSSVLSRHSRNQEIANVVTSWWMIQ